MSGVLILDLRPKPRRARLRSERRARLLLKLMLARAIGGSNRVENLLAKHKACNEVGGCRPPSRRDRKWQMIVAAYFASHP